MEQPWAGFSAIRAADDSLVMALAAGGPDERQSPEVCDANAAVMTAAPELAVALLAARQEFYDQMHATMSDAEFRGHPLIVQIDAPRR